MGGALSDAGVLEGWIESEEFSADELGNSGTLNGNILDATAG